MVVFVLLALLAIAGALGTIFWKNAVYSALSLVGTLLALAGVFVTLEAQFLASVQVIVYAGAIMVLFLFVIMLLNAQYPEEPEDPLPWLAPVAIAGGVVLAGALAYSAFLYKAPKKLEEASKALQGGNPGPIGEVLFTKFLLPFEAVSLLLIIAVVGAVALVKREPEAKQQRETLDEKATHTPEEVVA
ncbi:MAG: NADH-quinone oxidoreductase subunit J [Deinococcales bacterium]